MCADTIRAQILQISKTESDKIGNLVASFDFQWLFNPSIVGPWDVDKFFQFTHSFAQDGDILDEDGLLKIKSIIQFAEDLLKIKFKIYRIKANLITRTNFEESELKPLVHKDIQFEDDNVKNKKFVSMVYYVIDSDGDTILLDDDKRTIKASSSPIAGNLFVFDSRKWHRSTPPKINQRRVIINFILEVVDT
jgi:hypothetical protein